MKFAHILQCRRLLGAGNDGVERFGHVKLDLRRCDIPELLADRDYSVENLLRYCKCGIQVVVRQQTSYIEVVPYIHVLLIRRAKAEGA